MEPGGIKRMLLPVSTSYSTLAVPPPYWGESSQPLENFSDSWWKPGIGSLLKLRLGITVGSQKASLSTTMIFGFTSVCPACTGSLARLTMAVMAFSS
ncbi:hypothetical protein D3C81_2156030 [compost metagenome]